MKFWMRKRWQYWVSSIVLAGTPLLTGCIKPLYITPEADKVVSSVAVPADLATNPNIDGIPDLNGRKAPPTIFDPDREPYMISLREALGRALERGNRGNPGSGNILGLGAGSNRGSAYSDELSQFTGRGVAGDDSIRAFALDPAVADADIEGALSKFDARLFGNMNWSKRDTLVANIFNNFNNGDLATMNAGLYKPLPTGGLASVTFDMNYTRLSNIPPGFAVINPSYQPVATIAFEQPLLRDAGIDINQLLPNHPGSIAQPNFRPTGGRPEGILVTRIRSTQARLEFERELNSMVFNVEFAYWALYARYYQKYAAEQALRQSYVTLEQQQSRFAAGLNSKQQVAQAEAQLHEFRASYITALQALLEAERQMRGVLGMPLEDGKRLVPSDTPTLAPFKPDWQSALQDAMVNRPELKLLRQELKVQQLSVMLQQNNTRPDLRFVASYALNGNGTRLDGSGPETVIGPGGTPTINPGNAFASLTDNHYQNWTLGFQFQTPIGNRDAHAQMRVAQLNLARSHIQLENQTRKAELFLGSVYQQMDSTYKLIEVQRSRRIALGQQLEGQFEAVKIGREPLLTLLDAQSRFAQAIQAEADAITNYNIALAGFHLAKGTILNYNNISIGDGPLPQGVQERAADHYAARQAGLKLRDKADTSEMFKPVDAGTPLPGVLTKPGIEPTLMEKPKGTDVIPAPAPTPAPDAIPGVPLLKPVSVNPALPQVNSQDKKTYTLPEGSTPSVPVSKFRPQ